MKIIVFAFSFRKNLKIFMVEPLTKGSIFTCKFDYFLSNYSTPERTQRRYLSFSIFRSIFNQFFVNLINLKLLFFTFDLVFLPVFNKLFELKKVFIAVECRNSSVFRPKLVDSIEYDMKLFWHSEFFPSTDWKIMNSGGIRIF